MTESWTLDKGWGRRITNIYESCYLHIKCFPANSLAALMWRWYLNSERAALQLVVESSGRCEMGRKKLPEPNLHVYGKDDTKIMVYNMRRSPKRMDRKTLEKKRTKEQVTKNRALNSWLNYYNWVTQATPRIIFVSFILNISSKPPMIVTSFLKSS